jgi:hypothetical protein
MGPRGTIIRQVIIAKATADRLGLPVAKCDQAAGRFFARRPFAVLLPVIFLNNEDVSRWRSQSSLTRDGQPSCMAESVQGAPSCLTNVQCSVVSDGRLGSPSITARVFRSRITSMLSKRIATVA